MVGASSSLLGPVEPLPQIATTRATPKRIAHSIEQSPRTTRRPIWTLRGALWRLRQGVRSTRRVALPTLRIAGEGEAARHAGRMVLRTEGVVQWGLIRLAGVIGLLLAFGHDALPAVRTRVVLREPGLDAIEMEPVAARQHRHVVTERNRVHADGAVGLALLVEVGGLDGLGGSTLR